MTTKTRKMLETFVGKVGESQYKPQRKFMFDALRGLHVSGSIVLADWGRALREDKKLEHVEHRLSRNLNVKNRRFREEAAETAALELMAPLAKRHCEAVCVDGGEISKPYSKVQPFMVGVHDGSRGEVGNGWPLMSATGFNRNGRHIPLYTRVYSWDLPGFKSIHDEAVKCISAVLPYIKKGTPFLLDRAFDSHDYRRSFQKLAINFVVRGNLTEKRANIPVFSLGSQTWSTAAELRNTIKCTAVGKCRRIGSDRTDNKKIHVGWTTIRFSKRTPRGSATFEPEDTVYTMVKSKFDRGGSIVLYTNMPVASDEDAIHVARLYLCRWAVEEDFRLIKTEFGLENLRALKWAGIRRLVLLAHLARVFLTWLVFTITDVDKYIGDRMSFGPTPQFAFYRLRQVAGRELGL